MQVCGAPVALISIFQEYIRAKSAVRYKEMRNCKLYFFVLITISILNYWNKLMHL